MKNFIPMLAVSAAALAGFVCTAGGGAAAQRERTDGKPAAAAQADFTARRDRLAAAKSWGYQLRLISPAVVAASPFDLVVVDHAISANRRFVRQFTPEEVAEMKLRPDGSRRTVLAYLSIGEAERYRFYWKEDWYEPGKAPQWLGTANEQWDGNWRVRFWDPAWRDIVFSGADAYLTRIKAQGFDGVYLDRADVYHELTAERPGGRADMVQLITDLAAAARRDDPGFLVVMQNAEELLQHAPLARAIDGVAKEDLLFGAEREGEANPGDMVAGVLANLRSFRKQGRPVFVVEYVHDVDKARRARRLAAKEGFVLHFAERSLGILSVEPPDAAAYDPELRQQAPADR